MNATEGLCATTAREREKRVAKGKKKGESSRVWNTKKRKKKKKVGKLKMETKRDEDKKKGK